MQKGKVNFMTYITDDIMLTKHFDSGEFKCTCGCNTIKIDKLFVERMEKMFALLEKVVPLKAIIINSGYRCNNCSTRISGAFIGDMHNKGAAADLHAITADNKRVDCFTLAEAAQRVGFGGIAIITDTDIHIDDRQRAEFEYSNRQWYGNEAIGGTYATFIGKSKFTKQFDTKDDEKYIEMTIDNVKYTGYLKKL